jgi:hypothetical protein
MHIFMEYCRKHGLNCSIVAADFQEAFERAWRPGILYRLWEAGIRGNIWRIIDNMLSHTKACVRTNYGDTHIFETHQGVVQGSVLSAILFVLLVTPVSKALAKHAPSMGGLVISTQLFADDCTLPAFNPEQRMILITKFDKWTKRWNMMLKMKKTHLLTSEPENEITRVNDLVLHEISSFTLLGVEVGRDGVFTPTQIQIIATKIATTVVALMKISSASTDVSLALVLFLYKTMAFSVCAYSMPHVPNRRSLYTILNRNQISTMTKILSVPTQTDPACLSAELGLVDMELQAKSKRLLSYHKILSNTDDTLTGAMMKVPLDPNDPESTEMSNCALILQELGSNVGLLGFTHMPYHVLKLHLREMTTRKMQSRWNWITKNGNHAQIRLGRIKPKWGTEPNITNEPVNAASTYISMRANSFPIPQNENTCSLCGGGPPGYPHLLLNCQTLNLYREPYYKYLEKEAPTAVPEIIRRQANSQSHAAEFILGSGAAILPLATWSRIQQATIKFVNNIHTHISFSGVATL